MPSQEKKEDPQVDTDRLRFDVVYGSYGVSSWPLWKLALARLLSTILLVTLLVPFSAARHFFRNLGAPPPRTPGFLSPPGRPLGGGCAPLRFSFFFAARSPMSLLSR